MNRTPHVGLYFTRESLRLNGVKFIYNENQSLRRIVWKSGPKQCSTNHERICGASDCGREKRQNKSFTAEPARGFTFSSSRLLPMQLCSCKDLTGLIDPLIDTVPPVVPTEAFGLNDTRHYYSRGVCRRLHHRMRQAGEPDFFKNSLWDTMMLHCLEERWNKPSRGGFQALKEKFTQTGTRHYSKLKSSLHELHCSSRAWTLSFHIDLSRSCHSWHVHLVLFF